MKMSDEKTRIFLAVLLALVSLDLCFGSGFGMSPAHGDHGHHHHCDHGHGHGHDHHHHDHDYHQKHRHVEEQKKKKNMMLPEEMAEEEDMKLYGFGPYRDDHDHDHDHDHQDLSGLGLWLHALGCSLLVSLASLICLIILPVIFIQGKPSKAVVDSLALFGAGAMLGDAFLHQLPHAFGGEHSHSHDDHVDHAHHARTGHDHKHAHSLKDLSVGLYILAGIVLFLLVEKVVRYVEENSGGASGWSHGHHHHHLKSNKKLKNDDYDDVHDNSSQSLGDISDDSLNGGNATQHEMRKRKSSAGTSDDKSDIVTADGFANSVKTLIQKETSHSPSNLVFGYLNLFSDGVHNFTDGMALGSAFLLYGSVGGWSRTLFLLAHELPQEIGDFGILVRSGFSVTKALFFNFLSALVALVGTAVALLLGQDPGQSSLIEGFTAGGFIYIAVAGVLAEMNNNNNTTLRTCAERIKFQLSSTSGSC
ncbi:IAA-alanine resistance protein 1-like isoform X2 [Durio zibethinus]|uniref:IAA-alanine resistance protein 1-like isoform X2 n=1 Tax=Durio zibethinus TaxID=66656 RepID=A0A6P5XXP8_DURZI|nr:IAA-alanine resistance protein 1-like isoform X2 [Durio zibethinus]